MSIEMVTSSNGKETKESKKKKVEKEVVQLYTTPKPRNVLITIEGLTPFLSNRKHEGILKSMKDKQTGKMVERTIENPEEKWRLSQYLDSSGRPCIPGMMFKKSMINSGVFFQDKSFKRKLNGSVYINQDLLPIKYEKEEKKEDVLPLRGKGSSHIAYRMAFHGWSVTIPLQFNENVFNVAQIYNILETAGFSVGVGDNRPERGGLFGRYKIKR